MVSILSAFVAFLFCMALAGILIGAWEQATEADRRFHGDEQND